MTVRDIYSSDILLEQNIYENIFIYHISYKTYMGSKIVQNGFKNLRSKKSGYTDSINHIFARIRVDSYNSLFIEKTLIFHNVIILIKALIRIKITTTIFRKRFV